MQRADPKVNGRLHKMVCVCVCLHNSVCAYMRVLTHAGICVHMCVCCGPGNGLSTSNKINSLHLATVLSAHNRQIHAWFVKVWQTDAVKIQTEGEAKQCTCVSTTDSQHMVTLLNKLKLTDC